MASWVAPTTYVTGNTLTVGAWNALANDALFLYQAPYCNYFDSGGTSCPSGGTTQVTLSGTTTSGYGFSLSSSNVSVPINGVYQVSFTVIMTSGAGSGAAYIYASAYLNGTPVGVGSLVPSYTSAPGSTGATVVKCNAGDLLSLHLSNTSGSTLTTSNSAPNTFLAAAFIGSQ